VGFTKYNRFVTIFHVKARRVGASGKISAGKTKGPGSYPARNLASKARFKEMEDLCCHY